MGNPLGDHSPRVLEVVGPSYSWCRVLCGECGEIQNIKYTQMHMYTYIYREKYLCMYFYTTYENLKIKMEHKASVF